jgi:hypothetical protein
MQAGPRSLVPNEFLVEAAAEFSQRLLASVRAPKTSVVFRGVHPVGAQRECSAVASAAADLARSEDLARAAARFVLEAGEAVGFGDDVRAAISAGVTTRPSGTSAVRTRSAGPRLATRGGGDPTMPQTLMSGVLLMLSQLTAQDMIIAIDGATGDVRIEIKGMQYSYPLGPRVIEAASSEIPSILQDGRPPEAELKVLAGEVGRLAPIQLSKCVVVGKYLRYDEQTRNKLHDRVKQIKQPLRTKTDMRENFLIWAAPGSGKTFLIEQIAEDLRTAEKVPVQFVECNLSRDPKDKFVEEVNQLPKMNQPVLCLLDEIDARGDEDWPYEACFSHLDLNLKKDKQIVFVLIGSSQTSVDALADTMKERWKGKDLLSRVLVEQRGFAIPPLTTGDAAVMIAGEVLNQLGPRIDSIEKLALFYVLSRAALRKSPRQLTEFVKAAARRVPDDERRLRFCHLFDATIYKDVEFLKAHEGLLDDLKEKDVEVSR